MTDEKDPSRGGQCDGGSDSKWLREDLVAAWRENERLANAEAFRINGNPGPLFAALSKAQAAFEPIRRTREVHVKSDKANYTFAYAPLDEVLRATGKGLTENALALTQVISGPAKATEIRTILGHSSGAYMESMIRLPEVEREPQKLASAITYLRRYAAQAILGVAAEEDDDGAAHGTQSVAPRGQPAVATQKPTPAKAKESAPAQKLELLPHGGGPMTMSQYDAIEAAFADTEGDEIPKICKEVVGKDPPESAGSTSGWTSDDAAKLLAHLKVA